MLKILTARPISRTISSSTPLRAPNRPYAIIVALFLSSWCSHNRADELSRDVPLHGESVLHFASIDEGAERLRESDAYTKAMSRFDRQVRLASDGDVTEADMLRHAAAQVVAWSDDEVKRLTEVALALHKRLEPFRIPLPKRVLLIQTTGLDEGEAAYCRYPAVILPRKLVSGNATNLERLLAHELFHIVSRHDPKLRAKLYSLIGFESCEPIVAPESLRDRKITNPDAPIWDNVIALELAGGRAVTTTPILYASVEKYDPKAGGSLFKYLQFRVLVVERDAAGAWVSKLADGQPELLDPREIADFSRKIGKNTGYIIHPDEIMADNFVHLVLRKEGLPNPEIVEKIRLELAP